MLGTPNSMFLHRGIAKKKNLSQKSFFVEFGIDLCCFLEALGAVFLVSAAMKTGVKSIDFWWCNISRVGQVPEGNNFIFEACEQLNSTWLRAESRTAGAGG